jgi:hypothetical protein
MSETQPNNPLSDTQPNSLANTQPSSPDSQPSLAETQPSAANPSPALSDTQPRKIKPKRSSVWIGLLIIIGALALGGLGGYSSGIGVRISAKKTEVSKSLAEQMALVQQDIDAGRYALARDRLENYILKNDPSFPGATDKLAKVLVEMAITPSPTLTPIPTITPTPDRRAQEAIFNTAKQYLQELKWNDAIASLDSLRKSYPGYKVAQVDSMYYAALRNRGVDQIMGNGAYAQQTNLEGGIYDLTLAERFGPLDGSADGLRSFARMYIIGASFWELDWSQALDYFRQVYQFTPNLRDASNITATERYRIALLRYGDLIYGGKEKDRCNALDYYFQSFAIAPDPAYTQKVDALNLECNPPTAEPTITPEVSPTP